MNLALMEPYELDYPESNPQELDIGFAGCCTLSHDGSILFVGLYDGSIIAYVDLICSYTVWTSKSCLFNKFSFSRPLCPIVVCRSHDRPYPQVYASM